MTNNLIQPTIMHTYRETNSLYFPKLYSTYSPLPGMEHITQKHMKIICPCDIYMRHQELSDLSVL